MFRNSANTIRGVFIGMISGVILGSVFSCMIKENRRVKRKASKAVHAVGDFIEQVPSILR